MEREHEVEALGEAPGGQGVAQEHEQQQQQQGHEPANGKLKPAGDTPRHDKDGHGHERRLKRNHQQRIGEEPSKGRGGRLPRGALEGASADLKQIIKGPARNHAVEGQDQEARGHPHPANECPGGGGIGELHQLAHGVDGALPRFPAHEHFSHHDGDADEEDAGEVDEDERAPAVLPGHVGELPNIAEAHRRARRRQDEHPAAAPHAVLRSIASEGHGTCLSAKGSRGSEAEDCAGFRTPSQGKSAALFLGEAYT